MLSNLNEIAKELKASYENKYSHADLKIPKSAKDAYTELLLGNNKSLGYAEVTFLDYSFEVKTTSGKKISIPNFWFFAAAFFIPFLHEIKKYKAAYENVTRNIPLNKDWAIEAKKEKTLPISEAQLIEVGLTAAEISLFKIFMTDYEWWGGGKTIDRSDYYISPILKLGNFLAESQSAIAEICWQLSTLENNTLIEELDDSFTKQTQAKKNLPSPTQQSSSLQALPKPFLLLAGISGTGKTRFVRNQSEDNCLVTPVRPDWHEPSDILGYVSRLNAADKNTYVVTDVLCFVVRAWKAAFDSGVVFENEYVAGEKGLLDAIAPFWLCLDEMNLAPVEQYFADYLSVLESRRWCWEDDSFNYCSLPLLSSGVISAVDRQSLRADLQLENSSYDELWNYFCQNGITLPFNLIVAGTVNMDETTHGFSRKVIDRAITLDFGEFYPNGFDTFFDPMVEPKHFTYPRLSNIDNKDQLKDVAADADGRKTIAFLTAINAVLSDTPFELAYRALNELLLSVVCSNPKDDAELYAVWDDFLMTKVLPRIEGDADKLQKIVDGKALSLLPELLNVIKNQFGDMTAMRKDYFLKRTTGDDKAHFIPYRSPKKIEWMQARLNSATFTSFWP